MGRVSTSLPNYVAVDRNMLSGAPHVVGHRIHVSTVVGLKDSRAVLREDYGLDDETIDGVLQWAEMFRSELKSIVKWIAK